jgi:hypothetical protein
MANGLSEFAIDGVLNHLFSDATSLTKPSGLTLHLYKGDPHGAGTEVSDTVDDTAYAAQTITFEDEGTTQDDRVYNDLACTFAAVVYGSGAAPYDVTHWAVFADSATNMLAGGALPTTVTRLAGEPLVFSVGAIYVELTRTA